MSIPSARRISKQRRVLRGVVEGKTVTQAAIDAGYSPGSANVSGSRALHQTRSLLTEELSRVGLGLDQLAVQIKRGIDGSDLGKHDAYVKLALQCHKALDDHAGTDSVIGIGLFILKGLRERGLTDRIPPGIE